MPPLHRRDLLLGTALGIVAPPTLGEAGDTPDPSSTTSTAIPLTPIAPGKTIELWPGPPPGGRGPSMPESADPSGAVTDVSVPRMVMRRPSKPNGASVLILGGGGYRRISIAKESDPTANWLLDYGVTTFVLYYRLPNQGWPASAPFQDAQRAMRLIRTQADSLGLDESQIGIIGYSAGGHCAGITSTRPDAKLYDPVDEADERSARPDYAALIYPVLTMMPPNRTHISTLTLLGQNPSLAASADMSVDQQVTDDSPSTFLAHATDDPIAPVENSLLMFSALRKAHVPVEMHVFRSGGHGFNLGQPGAEDHAWPRLFATWAGFAKSER